MVYKSPLLLKTSCIGLVLSLGLLSSAAFAEALKVGVVGNAQGNVSATSVDGARRALTTGNDIFENDTIRTDAASRAQMLFLDKSALTLTPGSEVKIDKFVYNPASAGDGNLSLNGMKGAFRFIGGALSKENHVTVKTPVSTIGIRGGIVETHISPDGGTADAIFVYGHDMTVQDRKGQQVVVTDFGGGVNVQKGATAPVTLTPAKVEQKLQQFNAGANDAPAATKDSPAATDAPVTSNDTKKEESKTESDSSSSGDSGATAASSSSSTSSTQSSANTSTGTNSLSPIDLTSSTIQNATTAAANNAIKGKAQAGQVAPIIQEGRYRVNSLPVQVMGGGLGIGAPQTSNLSQGIAHATANAVGIATLFEEVTPETGKKQVASLPVPPAGQAFGTVGNVALGNDTYNGKVYSNGSGMLYYLLRNSAGTKELSFVVGNALVRDKWTGAVERSANSAVQQGRNGITFYHVLPTVGGNSSDKGSSDKFLENANGNWFNSTTGTISDGGNIAVDWANKKYLGASVTWGDVNEGFGSESNMTVTMGTVNPAGDNLMNGKIYDYSLGSGAQNSQDKAEMTRGIARTTPLVYGNDNGPITGFVFDAIESASFSGDGERIIAPATMVPGSDQARADTAKKTSGTMNGYAAGYVIDYADGASATAYWNNAPQGVTVTKDAANGKVGATIAVFDVNQYRNPITAKFGTAVEGGADSVLIDNKLFAAAQGSLKSSSSDPATAITSNALQSGVLLSGDSFTEVSHRCGNCEYVQWGIWAGEANVGTLQNPNMRVASMIPVVMGQPTLYSADMSNLGSVTYTGAMYGTAYNNTTKTLTQQDGSFSSGINLSTRTLTSFNGSIGGSNFSSSGTKSIGIQGSGSSAGLGFGELSVSGSGVTGVVNGSLYGPQAQNLGGNFKINTTSTSTTGVYLGSRLNEP